MEQAISQLLERYSMLVCWSLIHGDPPFRKEITDEQQERVVKKIEEIEDELKQKGVSDEKIQRVIDQSKQFIDTPLHKLTPERQDRLINLIFGAKKK